MIIFVGIVNKTNNIANKGIFYEQNISPNKPTIYYLKKSKKNRKEDQPSYLLFKQQSQKKHNYYKNLS